MSKRRERLWRRLDTAGHDACAIFEENGAHVIDGMAVFLHAGKVARLRYRVECDSAWITRCALVEGWVGTRRLELGIERDENAAWALNGEAIAELRGVVDVDLGFTPATNTILIRRLELAVGEESPAPAAWIDTADWRLKRLDQHYRRVSVNTYHYSASDQGYEGSLAVDDEGTVVTYPGLWQLVA